MTTRRSFWRIHLAQARKTRDWYRIPRHYTRITAAQICSDIRGHRRIAGINPNETWIATYETSDDPNLDWATTIHIKLLEPTYAESAET